MALRHAAEPAFSIDMVKPEVVCPSVIDQTGHRSSP
jgi:hypothetical protein